MTSLPSPVPEGAPVIVNLVDGHASRWIDPHDHTDQDDPTPSRPRCSLFKRGHHVHFIQANHGLRTPSRPFALVDVDGDELVVAADDGAIARWWVHDTEFARAALLIDERPTVHLHGLGLARIGSTVFYPYMTHDEPLEPCTWNEPGAVDANGGSTL